MTDKAIDNHNVVGFPRRPQRSWRLLETYLCPMLYQAGADTAQVVHLCTVLQPIWEADQGVTLSDTLSPEEYVQGLNRWFSNMAQQFLIEIAVRELKLFNAGIE